MLITNLINIWRKELTDTLRDRKALSQTLMVPLIIGLFYAVLNPALGRLIQSRADDPITIPTQGLEYVTDDFVALLAEFQITLEPFEGDLDAVIVAGEEAAGLIVPPDFGEQVAGEIPASVTLLVNPYSGGVFGGGIELQRVEFAVTTYNQQVSAGRLQIRNVDPALLTPVTMDMQDLSTPAQRAGAFASLMLPLLVGIIAAQGGMFIAIDVTAGEKERGTLEALLVTPTSDTEIFVGKLAAVFTMTLLPVVLTLMGYWVGSNLLPTDWTDGAVLPLSLILQTILLALPLSFFLNVVLMAVSIRTKAFKDAQSSAGPLIFGVTMAAMAAAFVPPVNTLLYLIPIYGTSAIVGKLAVGGAVPMMGVVLSVVGSLAAAAIGIIISLRLFNRERLLYSM
ncbi:MAG: ABC transporter permease [Chloroflexi bacterium]|nr:ABC transporter permease [Chloroflexota bacterium]